MSNAIRCPKCPYHEQAYQAPLGKILRNPHANTGKIVWDDCNACNGTGYIPLVVLDSIRNSFPKSYEKIVKDLRWSMDHYSFVIHGMYVGVEVSDGYIHT